MKIAIMQPYFFPYIGYWQLISSVNVFIVYDDVNYIKGGWVNRNKILINNEARFITVPLEKASPNKLIYDIHLDSSLLWRKKTIRTIENTYRRAPFFKEAFDIIEPLIFNKEENLSVYLTQQLMVLAQWMGIQTKFIKTSRNYNNNDLSGAARVIDICKKENATGYINPQGGMSLYNKEDFSQEKIDLKYLVPNYSEYKQFNNLFVPWLSIIDVMMFNSKENICQMLSNYELL